MDSLTTTQAQADYLCGTCGAWVRNGKTICQWCGTPAPTNTAKNNGGDSLEDTSSILLGEDDTTLTLTEWKWSSPESAVPFGGRPRRFWRRAFLWSLLLVVLMLAGSSALGIYHGLNDRQVQSKREAIEYFNQGRILLEEGRYELAAASFREALRLEPNFEAAAQLLEIAQHNAEVEAGILSQESAPPTPAPSDNERLFTEAQAAMQRGEWEMAAATFDLLSTQAPGFQSEAVSEGLFASQVEAGHAALARGDLDQALSHYDHALTVYPDDAEIVRLRRATSAYRAGLQAFEDKAWCKAANQFRVVYLLDPDFMDTTTLLAQAHLELGKAFEARTIWCQAAQEYRSSAAVVESEQVLELAKVAETRCETRVTAPRAPTVAPTQRSTFPTRTPEGEDEEGELLTPLPSTTPLADETPSVDGTPQAGETPLPEETPLVIPTSTPAVSGLVGYQLVGGVGESFDESCGGHYIRGIVRAPDGAPLAGVTILAIDQFGNRLTAVTKSDPLGQYDIPIPAQFISYEVMVVGEGQSTSTSIIVQHGERFVQAAQACHILNWQQVP